MVYRKYYREHLKTFYRRTITTKKSPERYKRKEGDIKLNVFDMFKKLFTKQYKQMFLISTSNLYMVYCL